MKINLKKGLWGVFKNIDSPCLVAWYHSLMILENNFTYNHLMNRGNTISPTKYWY